MTEPHPTTSAPPHSKHVPTLAYASVSTPDESFDSGQVDEPFIAGVFISGALLVWLFGVAAGVGATIFLVLFETMVLAFTLRFRQRRYILKPADGRYVLSLAAGGVNNIAAIAAIHGIGLTLGHVNWIVGLAVTVLTLIGFTITTTMLLTPTIRRRSDLEIGEFDRARGQG